MINSKKLTSYKEAMQFSK